MNAHDIITGGENILHVRYNYPTNWMEKEEGEREREMWEHAHVGSTNRKPNKTKTSEWVLSRRRSDVGFSEEENTGEMVGERWQRHAGRGRKEREGKVTGRVL